MSTGAGVASEHGPMTIVDTHTHAISTDTDRYPVQPVGGRQSTWSQQRPVTVEQLIAQMDAAGIDQAVLVHASTAYGFDNSYAADSLAGRESRLVGVCAIDFVSPDGVADLEYWIGERGFSGVRIKSHDVPSQFEIFDDPRAEPVWGWLAHRGISACVSLNPDGVVHLRNLIRRFPELRVIIDHAGSPDVAAGPPYPGAQDFLALADLPGVHLKLTSVTFERIAAAGANVRDVVGTLVDRFGPGRLMWGTNFPATAGSMGELLAEARDAFSDLSDADHRAIFARTARTLYPALGTP